MQSGWMIPPDVIRMLAEAAPRRVEPADVGMRSLYSMLERGPMHADVLSKWYRWLPGRDDKMTLHVCSDRPDLDIVKTLRSISRVFRNVFSVVYMCTQLDASFGRNMYSGCIVWGDRLEKDTFRYRTLKRFQENLSAAFYTEMAVVAQRKKYPGALFADLMLRERYFDQLRRSRNATRATSEIAAATRTVHHIIGMMRHGFRPPMINVHADTSSRVFARIMTTLYERYIRDSSGIFVMHLVHYGHVIVPDDVNVSTHFGDYLRIEDATKLSDDDRDSFMSKRHDVTGIPLHDFSSLYPSIIMTPNHSLYGVAGPWYQGDHIAMSRRPTINQATLRGIRVTTHESLPAGAFTPFTTDQGRRVMREAAAQLRQQNIRVTYGDTAETPEGERVGMVMYMGSEPYNVDHDGDEMTRVPPSRPATAADFGEAPRGKRAEKRLRKDRHLTRGKDRHSTHSKQK